MEHVIQYWLADGIHPWVYCHLGSVQRLGCLDHGHLAPDGRAVCISTHPTSALVSIFQKIAQQKNFAHDDKVTSQTTMPHV